MVLLLFTPEGVTFDEFLVGSFGATIAGLVSTAGIPSIGPSNSFSISLRMVDTVGGSRLSFPTED